MPVLAPAPSPCSGSQGGVAAGASPTAFHGLHGHAADPVQPRRSPGLMEAVFRRPQHPHRPPGGAGGKGGKGGAGVGAGGGAGAGTGMGALWVAEPPMLRGLRVSAAVHAGPVSAEVAVASHGRVAYSGRTVKELLRMVAAAKTGQVGPGAPHTCVHACARARARAPSACSARSCSPLRQPMAHGWAWAPQGGASACTLLRVRA